MGTRPQTMYGLADSPVFLAAWMLNHDAASYQDIADAFAGHPVGGLTRDEVLDNITYTWLTNTGVSSARLYWENTVGFFDGRLQRIGWTCHDSTLAGTRLATPSVNGNPDLDILTWKYLGSPRAGRAEPERLRWAGGRRR